MTLDALVRILWRHKLLVLAAALLGGVAAIGITMVTPKVYSATSVSFVTAVAAPGKGASYETAQFAVSRAKSYPPLLRSPQVIAGVSRELSLQMSEEELARRLTAVNPVDTLLIEIVAQADSPDLAPRMANSAARLLATEIRQLETGGAKRQSPVDVQLAVPATMPRGPSQPRPVVNLALGLLSGVALGAMAALVRDARSNRVVAARRSAAEAEALGSQPTEAEAPQPRRFVDDVADHQRAEGEGTLPRDVGRRSSVAAWGRRASR